MGATEVVLVDWSPGQKITKRKDQTLNSSTREAHELFLLSKLLEGRSWTFGGVTSGDILETTLDGYITHECAVSLIEERNEDSPTFAKLYRKSTLYLNDEFDEELFQWLKNETTAKALISTGTKAYL